MSDPKRATLITVGASKNGTNNVNKTVRLTINLVESNESKYPELNYKELVSTEERKKVENGKTPGLDPFSDNDDDVERVARKFEQKYGGKSTYGKKRGRTKQDDFADIGAGYDENDSFIDNTDGYDEMIPPECDTLYGGFYINSGSLEFKNVDNQVLSDAEPGNRRNKRRISSSSSEESSESSSESSPDEKAAVNGVRTDTEHRKKNKKIDKKKAKKIRRTDSSAATSGKQTSDDNGHAGGSSADSRTSQSDSLASKPAPSSENAVTSDSSRDAEAKLEVKLPPGVVTVVEELEAIVGRLLLENPNLPQKELEAKTDSVVERVQTALLECAEASISRASWNRVARALRCSRTKLLQRLKAAHDSAAAADTTHTQNHIPVAQSSNTSTSTSNKRKADNSLEDVDVKSMTPEEREANIIDNLKRLRTLIEERKPGMISSYNAECARVQEERKKIQIASADGAPHIEKRLPKRRFPWCPRARALLARLKALAGDQEAAAILLAKRALPLFPRGFVRMPTLLRQADLSKEIKATDLKRQRLNSFTQQPPPLPFTEPIQFPSSLTVTTTVKTSPDKPEVPIVTDDKFKTNSVFGTIINSFSLGKDITVEKPDERKDTSTEKGKEDLYIPPNNIGSITITPVHSNKEKKVNTALTITEKYKETGLIRVKSPAALNEMVKKDKEKQEKLKKAEKEKKRVDTPLHIDTNVNQNKKEPSPKSKEEVSQKQLEIMRVAENDLPRPALIPVHHSPTFAKPDKRPPETKKKKEVLIISDVDPLGDVQTEPVSVDDSSSDVEVIEENTKSDKSDKSEVPSKDIVSRDSKTVNSVKHKHKDGSREKDHKDVEEATKEDIDKLMRNISEMEHSQEQKLNSNSFGGLLNNARHEKSSSALNRMGTRDKLSNFFEQNGWM